MLLDDSSALNRPTNLPPPPRPPPPKIFPDNHTDVEGKNVLDAEPLEEVPELNIPQRTPRLYELVAQDTSSFWWDSVDAKENPMFGVDIDGTFIDDFETELSMSVYEGRRGFYHECAEWLFRRSHFGFFITLFWGVGQINNSSFSVFQG